MRKWTETVKVYQDLVGGKPYRVRVKNVSRRAKPRAVEIDVEFLDASQQGRRLITVLSLPIRPGSLTASFFAACGLAVAAGTKIAPCEATNAVIAASFERTTDGKGWHAIDFKSISKG